MVFRFWSLPFLLCFKLEFKLLFRRSQIEKFYSNLFSNFYEIFPHLLKISIKTSGDYYTLESLILHYHICVGSVLKKAFWEHCKKSRKWWLYAQLNENGSIKAGCPVGKQKCQSLDSSDENIRPNYLGRPGFGKNAPKPNDDVSTTHQSIEI
jgi:hypothetical protein